MNKNIILSSRHAAIRGQNSVERLKPRAGFTLTELLAIVAMLAVLVSVMTPALGRVKPGYQAFHCMNNLRRVMNAMTFYTYDNHDLLPPNPDDGVTTPGYTWCAGQAGLGGADEFDPDLLRDPARTLVAPYLNGDTEVFRCTANTLAGLYDGGAIYPQSSLKGKQVPTARSISMNNAVGTIDPYYASSSAGHSGIPNLPVNGPWLTGSYNQNSAAKGPWRTYGKLTQMVAPAPSQLFVLTEESPYSINDGTFAMSVGAVKWVDYPSTLHNYGCALAFGDAHAELHKWADPSTEYLGGATTVPTNGLDWTWLASRTSAKVSQ